MVFGSAGNRLLVSRSERFLPLRNEINVGSLRTSLHLYGSVQYWLVFFNDPIQTTKRRIVGDY